MNRPGQPSRSSDRPNSGASSGPRGRKSSTRAGITSDDEGLYSRKTSRNSSYGPLTSTSSSGNFPIRHRRDPTGSSSRARGGFSPTQPRASFGYLATKAASTPSTPYQSAPRGGPLPLAEPSRSNPTAPVWSAGPNQPRGVGFNTRTPNRNAGHVSAPSTLRGPGRKATSIAPPMWDPANEPQSLKVSRMTPTPTPRKRPPIEIIKSTNFPKPFWQHQDDEYEARQKAERRMNKFGELRHHATPSKQPLTQPRRAYLNPAFQIIKDPPSDNEEENRDKDDRPMQAGRMSQQNLGVKTMQSQGPRPRVGSLANRKAARKSKWRPPPKESSEDSSSESSSPSSSSNSIIELTDTESETGNGATKEVGGPERQPVPDKEIVIVEPPQPVITISLPQITPVVPRLPSLAIEPPETLIAALDQFCLPSIRMQKTKQLPFLLRNLRRGFRLRCNSIGIKTAKSRPKMPVIVRYEYTESIFETYMSKWLCPLCELHGALPNKEMLRRHFQWDHPEVILERWGQRTNNQGKAEWRMHILVPEVIYESIQPREYDLITKSEPQEVSVGPDTLLRSEKSMSPSAPPSEPPYQSSAEPSVEPLMSRDVTPKMDSNQDHSDAVVHPMLQKLYPRHREDLAAQLRRASAAPSWTSRSRSVLTSTTEQTDESLSTVRIEHTPGPAGGLYPSPPPTHDPLGPAAQYPYLPAQSEYGGPDIHYSCRPGGPSTYDLLGTLPMEPFGVLEWDILEREEEIYESDDVKVEYKVMHALWLRWITLHRTTFMQNYYKGTLAFIDEYWRMIHQAAGWRAMRHWLLGLFAHRFLTTREVAKALKHYEDFTGMPFW